MNYYLTNQYMSWGTCFAGSNNTNFSYPALMSDGRFSNWSQDAVINQQIRNKNGITTNLNYRKFLVNNANSIIERNQQEACGQCCNCPTNYGVYDKSNPNQVPYLYNSSYAGVVRDKSFIFFPFL